MGGTPYEIERKFVLDGPDVEALEAAATSVSRIEQTYLLNADGHAERVRRRVVRDADGTRVELTTTRKVGVASGVVEEYERELDEAEYAGLLARTDPDRKPVVKTRWVVPYGGHVLEVDRLESPRSLWLLEVELQSRDELAATIPLPAWVGPCLEVTGDERYTNRALALPEDPAHG